MSFFEKNNQIFKGIRNRLDSLRERNPQLPSIFLLLPFLVGIVLYVWGLFANAGIFELTELPEDSEAIGLEVYKANTFLAIMTRALYWAFILSLGILIFRFITGIKNIRLRELAIVFGLFALFVVCRDISLNWAGAKNSFLGESSSIISYYFKLALHGLLAISPVGLVYLYKKGSILDRYTAQSLLGPMLLSTLGITVIWIIFDLADNLPDFANKDNNTSLGTVLKFYGVMIPKMVVEILPVGVLLGTLYSLGRLSQFNELVSMLGSGRSLYRVLMPFFVVGLLASALCFTLNYELAPKAEGIQESMIRAIREGGDKIADRVVKQKFRNREQNRTWYIGSLPFDIGPGKSKMKHVSVTQEDDAGKTIKQWVAKQALWWPRHKIWRLYNVREVKYGEVYEDMVITDYFEKPDDKIDIEGWKETPWMIFSSTLDPEHMSVSELLSYQKTNNELTPAKLAPYKAWKHYRLANPWRIFVIVVLCAPLSIVFSRRGLLGGVVASVVLFFTMFFLDSLLLALAQGYKLNPQVAGWATNVLFLILGCFLLYRKNANKELKLNFNKSLKPKQVI